MYARIIDVILETERLILRPFRDADLDAYVTRKMLDGLFKAMTIEQAAPGVLQSGR